ncbi:MAG: c-type cytochrome biogenesis protein CcsB [Deltaproteobacteria bacterium]|nr:c-type cytochrome biogenesis protein CcsB [Deltaproteobacteria bacterium]
MEIVTIIFILLYMLSAVGYFTYLFLQKDYLQKSGFFILFAGFLLHTAIIAFGFISTGHFPAHNLQETLMVAGWAIAGVFLIIQYKFNLKILGVFASPLIVLIVIAASLLPGEPVQTTNIFKNFWLISHIIIIFIGEASFALACVVGILYLMQERAIKIKIHGFFFRRLPSLELLDTTGYACIVFGFTMLTIGLITGLVYAKSVWGRFWSWDPKEVWSAITWLLYAALLHERLVMGWRGRKAAIMAIVGFAFLLFTFFGVNFLLKGHHGVFTKF